MIAALHLALQLAIVAHAPDTAQTCDAVDVSVAVSAPAGAVPRLAVPSLAPFDLLRASATQTDAGNGRIRGARCAASPVPTPPARTR